MGFRMRGLIFWGGGGGGKGLLSKFDGRFINGKITLVENQSNI